MSRAIDRSGWGRGPWDAEPDRVEFEHTGLPCLLRRNRSGHLYDVVPSMPELEARYPVDAVYRDMAYVRTETTRLSQQLAATTWR